jgi:hypothetical protein
MSSRPPRSEVGAQRAIVLGVGLVAVLVLVLGLSAFLHFEPRGQRSGLEVRVVGVYPIDPATGSLVGPATTTYRPDQAFGAVVDWSSLPAQATVAAHWYDAMGTPVGGVGPGSPAELSREPVVGTRLEAGGRPNLPGTYVFVVERWSGGRAVEVLARSAVLVVNG